MSQPDLIWRCLSLPASSRLSSWRCYWPAGTRKRSALARLQLPRFACSFWWLVGTYCRYWSTAFVAKEQTTFCEYFCSARHVMGYSQKNSNVRRSRSVQLPHGFWISRRCISSAPAPISSSSLFASRFAAWPIFRAKNARKCFSYISSPLQPLDLASEFEWFHKCGRHGDCAYSSHSAEASLTDFILFPDHF